jgi:hypothetical protein
MSFDSSAAAGHEITERATTTWPESVRLRWKVIPECAASRLSPSRLIGDLQMRGNEMPTS